MFVEVFLISNGLYFGSKLYKRIKGKINERQSPLSVTKTKDSLDIQTVLSDSPEDRKYEKTEYEKTVDRSLSISLASVVLASTGALFYPPLSLLSIPGILYPCNFIFRKMADAIFKERRIRIEVLDSIAIVVGVACGYWVACAVANATYFGAQKLRLKTEKNSKQNLIDIFEKNPNAIWILKDGVEVEIPFELLQVADIVVVNAGEPIPADGVIKQGIASIDQHILSGESQPAEKSIGDRVFASSILISGKIYIQVEKAGKETVAAKIGEILKKTSVFTTSVESIGQEMADKSVIPTLGVSLYALPFVGIRGMSALLCGNYLDTMRTGVPISMLNFLHIASHESILIKDGRSLQLIPEVDTVIFDKTGTLTLDQPHIRTVHTFNGTSENTVLTHAAAAEHRQSHPIATAILCEAKDRGLNVPHIGKASYKVGYGITVEIGQQLIRVGSNRFMEMEGIYMPNISDAIRIGHEQGHSFVFVAADNLMIGAIELEPTIRPEAKQVIHRLKQYNVSFWIISGDDETPTRIMSQRLGIDNYFAKVLPEKKAEMVEQLQKQGKKVCFVGDGINDSIALKKANVSISICGASTAATDSAQIILLDNSLKKLPDLFHIAHAFNDNMRNSFSAVSLITTFGVGGVFFMSFGIPVMTMLLAVSLSSCMIISMLPVMKYEGDKDKISDEPLKTNTNLMFQEPLPEKTREGNLSHLSDSDNYTPLYQGLYYGPEGKELTVSLRARPCRFNCTMCAWKDNNSSVHISEDDIIDQIRSVISNYDSRIHEVKQFSFGNQGSLLDEKTFNPDTLFQISKMIGTVFPRISFETRAAFISQDKIDMLKQALGSTPFEFAIGFETRDNHIRQKILKKGIPLKIFEKKTALLAENNIFTRVYIMLKSSPYMNEKEGVEECVKTIKYLYKLSEKNRHPMTVHLNPTFIVRGSQFEAMAIEQGYTPPKLWSIAEVLHRVKNFPIKIHLGLSTEGSDKQENGYIFGNCRNCNADFTRKLKKYNKHHRTDILLNELSICDCRPNFITF